MKNENQFCMSLLALLFVGSTGCSQKSGSFTDARVPEDWYHLPEVSRQEPQPVLPAPEVRAERAVQSLFQVYTDALDQVEGKGIAGVASGSAPLSVPFVVSPSEPGSENGIVPWHLEGMIANFGISLDGIVGTMGLGGSAAIKGVWRKVAPESQSAAVAPKAESKVSKGGGEKIFVVDGSEGANPRKQLEPAINAALASGKVKDAGKFRQGVMKIGEQFSEMTRTLESIHFADGWSAEALRLEVTVDASGMVTPGISVGGTLYLRLDWLRPEADMEHAESKPQSVPASELGRNLSGFTQAMAQEIQAASEEAEDFHASGFELEEVRIGIGVTAGGEIGVAQTSASVMGSITFEKEGEEEKPEGGSSSPSADSIALIGSEADPEKASYAARNGVEIESFWDGIVYRVKRSNFRRGLVRAIGMGEFFARNASHVESERWKVSEIEAEFQMSVGGTLGVVTVDASGLVVLGFSRGE